MYFIATCTTAIYQSIREIQKECKERCAQSKNEGDNKMRLNN